MGNNPAHRQTGDGDRVQSGLDMAGDAIDGGHNSIGNSGRIASLDRQMKIQVVLLCTMLIMILSIVIIVLWLAIFDQNPPFEIYNNPLPTEKTEYKTGERVRFFVDFCRYTDAPYTLYLQFENGLIYSLPPVKHAGTKRGECNTAWSSGVVIPLDLPAGEYHVIGRAVYDINILAERVVSWESQRFTVLAK